MALSDPLSVSSNFPKASDTSKNVAWTPIQVLDCSLPFGETIRNGLSLVFLIGLVICFWQPLVALYALTQQDPTYSHVVLIPLISLYALYLNRKAIRSSKAWSPWLGSCVTAFGALWAWRAAVVDYGANALTVQMMTFVAMCWGIFLFCYGMKIFRTCSFSLLFLLWMVPLPVEMLNAFIVFLQRNSAEVTDMVFSFIGIPFYREGFIFALTKIKIHIAEECSGIRSTLSLLITSLVIGHFFLRSVWGRWGLVIIVVPLAIIKNAFRIVGLSLLGNYVDPSFLTNSVLHRAGGIPLFAVSVVILSSVAWLLRNMEKRNGYFPPDQSRAKV